MDKNRYVPVHRIGGRQMGELSVVLDRKLNEKKYVLQLSKTAARKVLPFCKAAKHDVLPPFLNLEEDGDEVCLFFRYIEGTCMKELIQNDLISQQQAVHYVRQMGQFLGYLQNDVKMVVHHLDLERIYVTEEGNLLLLDFTGIREMGEGKERKEDTEARSQIRLLLHFLNALLDRDDAAYRTFCEKQENSADITAFLKDLNRLEKMKRCERWFQRNKKKIRMIAVVCFVGCLFAALFGPFAGGTIPEDFNSKTSTPVDSVSPNTLSHSMSQSLTDSLSQNFAAPKSSPQNPAALDPASQNHALTARQHHDAARYLLEHQESVSNALMKARDHLEAAKLQIEHMEGERKVECQMENLAMISMIYKLLGKKDTGNRTVYYEKSMECIQQFLLIPGAQESEYYRARLSDFVELKEEMGERDEAIACLEEWERQNPDIGKELYFYHAFLLMKCAGKEDKVRILAERMEQVDEVKEDFRYEQVKKMITQYIREGDAYANETE